jgi:hypothetical protein
MLLFPEGRHFDTKKGEKGPVVTGYIRIPGMPVWQRYFSLKSARGMRLGASVVFELKLDPEFASF